MSTQTVATKKPGTKPASKPLAGLPGGAKLLTPQQEAASVVVAPVTKDGRKPVTFTFDPAKPTGGACVREIRNYRVAGYTKDELKDAYCAYRWNAWRTRPAWNAERMTAKQSYENLVKHFRNHFNHAEANLTAQSVEEDTAKLKERLAKYETGAANTRERLARAEALEKAKAPATKTADRQTRATRKRAS